MITIIEQRSVKLCSAYYPSLVRLSKVSQTKAKITLFSNLLTYFKKFLKWIDGMSFELGFRSKLRYNTKFI